MRRIIPVMVGVILLLLSICFSYGAIAQIDVNCNFKNFENVGDYIEVSYWTDEDGLDLNGHMRMELTCDETLIVQGKSYDCHVISVKGSGDFDTGLGPIGTWEISGEQYSDKSDGSSVKSELLMEMTMTYQGETAKMTSDTTMERMSWSTNWTSEEDPDIGNFWMET